MTNFVNFKIKPIQSFRGAYSDRVCVHVFIGVSTPMCMSICIYTVFKKTNCLATGKILRPTRPRDTAEREWMTMRFFIVSSNNFN
jgi:hypothetical protein